MLRSIALALGIVLVPAMASAQATEGVLKRVAASKTVAIAYRADASPFSFLDDSKQPVGFSIDLCRRVVSQIAQQIGVEGVQIKWVPVTIETRMEAIEKGQADMECGSTTATLARSRQVNFSSFIFVDGTGLLIKSSSTARGLSDMGGAKIGVIPGTTNERALNDALKRTATNATVVPVKTRDEGFALFEAGRIDAFASDRVLLMAMAPKAKDASSITMLLEDLSFEPYAIVLPRGDDGFRLAVNTALARIYRSDAVGEIFARWFGALGKPGLMLQATYVFGGIPE